MGGALGVANLVRLVQNHAIPVDVQQGADGAALASADDRVGSDHDPGRVVENRCSAFHTVKDVHSETRHEPRRLSSPLTDDGLGHDDERARADVDRHGGKDLYSFTQTHLVTQEATCIFLSLAADHPLDPLVLVRSNQPGAEHFFYAKP